jgi:hypothetical protein
MYQRRTHHARGCRTHARRTHTRTRVHARGSGLVLQCQSLTVATANIGLVTTANNRRNQCNRDPRHCSCPRCHPLQNVHRRNSLPLPQCADMSNHPQFIIEIDMNKNNRPPITHPFLYRDEMTWILEI